MAGRAVLWCLVAVLLLRSAGDVLATPEQTPAKAVKRGVPVVAWPDDEARAFAMQFARAYLGLSAAAVGTVRAGAVELGCAGAGELDRSFARTDHCDHVHIGWDA